MGRFSEITISEVNPKIHKKKEINYSGDCEEKTEKEKARKEYVHKCPTRMRGNVILPEESTRDDIGNPDSFQLNATLRINPRFPFFLSRQQVSQGRKCNTRRVMACEPPVGLFDICIF